MIIKLHKYLIVGSRSEMDAFFSLAQKAGFMEFIGLSHKKTLEIPEDGKTMLSAIKILRAHQVSHEIVPPVLSPIELARKIVHLNEMREKILEEMRLLNAESVRVAPFGHFSREELDEVEKQGKRFVQFFCMKSVLSQAMTLPSELIYVGTDYDLDYFVAINKEKKQYPKMVEITIDRPIGDLRAILDQRRLEFGKIEKEIHNSASALPFLQNGLIQILNEYHLHVTKYDASHPLNESLFAIEAWVPENKIKSLFGLLSDFRVHAEEIAIEEHDRIPTCMENHRTSKVGQDLVNVYDIPAATDKDPSLWVLIFFSLFFAMIIADAGYGLIYLGFGLLLKWKYKDPAPFLKRFIKLIFIASSACILWGLLTVSFFGIEIGPNNPVRKVSLLHYMAAKKAEYHMTMHDDVYQEYAKEFPAIRTATDGHDFLVKASSIEDGKVTYNALNDFYDSTLLEFSLFVGTIHIALSFIRYIKRNPVGWGWIVFLIGGYLYFPSFVDATSFINYLGWLSKPLAYAIGEMMLYTGLCLVFIIALLQKRKWGALHEITNSIQIFADVLSYLRLYALALSGMIMAQTFNDLGLSIGIFGGIFLILIGHIVNLSLTVMSGVIHGLRLNFLEWYHYCFEGGGRLFNPLRIRKQK